MKINFLFLAIILTISPFITQAQDWSTDVYKYGELYPGYIVDESGNKTEGYIKYQNRYAMQNEVLFYADQDDKKSKVKYKTDDLKEYVVADKVYHCIHYSGGLMSKPVKANLLVKDGCIAEYVWYNRADNYLTIQKSASETEEEFMARMYPPQTIFLKKGTDTPKSVDQFALKFASKMSDWVSDNKALAAKVANKEKGYGMLRMLDIIAEYNESCK